jgi:membrane protein involved in colicin uptake
MREQTLWLARFAAPIALIAGCASYPAPQERMASSEGALRAAQEVGAQSNADAALHVRLAQEEINSAKSAMSDGDNKRAEYMLVRAKADAELAMAEAREAEARTQAQQAADQARLLQESMSGGRSMSPGMGPRMEQEGPGQMGPGMNR